MALDGYRYPAIEHGTLPGARVGYQSEVYAYGNQGHDATCRSLTPDEKRALIAFLLSI